MSKCSHIISFTQNSQHRPTLVRLSNSSISSIQALGWLHFNPFTWLHQLQSFSFRWLQVNGAETVSADLSEVLNALQLIESHYMKGRFEGHLKSQYVTRFYLQKPGSYLYYKDEPPVKNCRALLSVRAARATKEDLMTMILLITFRFEIVKYETCQAFVADCQREVPGGETQAKKRKLTTKDKEKTMRKTENQRSFRKAHALTDWSIRT